MAPGSVVGGLHQGSLLAFAIWVQRLAVQRASYHSAASFCLHIERGT